MPTATVEYAFWREQARLSLASGVVRTTIADGRAALRATDGRFVALSRGSERLIDLLDVGCSGAELERCVALPEGEGRALAEQRLAAFLDGLGAARMLTVSRVDADRTRLGRFVSADLFTRITAWRKAEAAFQSLGSGTRRWFPPSFAVGAAVMALLFGLSAVPVLTFDLTPFDPWLVLTLPGVLVIQILLHETMHGLVLGYLRLPVKSAGVGLLLGVFPTAYVDRTGAYAVRNRLARSLISLAGPLCDLVLLGLVGLGLRLVPAEDQGYLQLIGILLATIVAINLNPLLPSDGQHALEAAMGGVNTRVRAYTYVCRRLTGKTLPFALRETSRRARAGFWLCTVGSGLYLAFVAVGVIRTAVGITAAAWKALGW